ncbi:hypothetical protein BGX27_003569 [Mortierella sp. AM989]|nr:hypothetical protein BGX27_003569 [Mortierella sp. AM989]
MTTEELEQAQPQQADIALPESPVQQVDVSLSETPVQQVDIALSETPVLKEKSIVTKSLLAMDNISALMNDYRRRGWIMLSDGCPDCNTPLMRNQEATNQVCVSCEITPPVDDPEEEELIQPQQMSQEQSLEHQVQAPRPKPHSAPLVIMPPLSLPSLAAPEPVRPFSPPNARISVLDPVLDATRKSHHSPSSGRGVGVPTTPTLADFPSPPPRSTTPLLRPPKTPPLNLRPRLSVRPPGPPPAGSSLISPPSSPSVPKLLPRNKRRSPQGSMVSGIQSPPARPSVHLGSPLPSPPTSATVGTSFTSINGGGATLWPSDIMISQMSNRKHAKGSHMDTASLYAEAEAPSEAHKQTHESEHEDGKGHESHDEFEGAEGVINRPSDEVKARESKREQNEKASRLMGQKMLQGWTMLQESCSNPGCNSVPLMRSREKKDYCVVCEKYYLREQDLDLGKYTITTPPVGPATSVSTQNTLSPLAHATEQKSNFNSTSQFPAPSNTMPPVPRAISPPTIPSSGSYHSRSTSPISSPGHVRPTRDFNGRISSPIVLPPPVPMSPSFGMTSQQILSRYQNDELDKVTIDEEEMKKHIQLIGKMSEFSSRSLPPVPPVPVSHNSAASRPISTYSNTSDKERHSRNHHHGAPSSPRPLSPEVQAMIDLTHKTMSTLLAKVEVYRLALELTENPKESQALTLQIKGLMECLKACREVL